MLNRFLLKTIWVANVCLMPIIAIAQSDYVFPDLGMENQVRIYNRTCHLQVHKWLKQSHFKDSVTVKEMKEAFYQNYKYATSNNPYAGFDSLTAPFIGGNNYPAVIITEVMKSCPEKRLRPFRGIWRNTNLLLQSLTDTKGQECPKHIAQIAKRWQHLSDWYHGDVVWLFSPKNYMGFIVSGHPAVSSFYDGTQVAYNYYSGPTNFFQCFNQRVLDGDWHATSDISPFALSNFLNLAVDIRNIECQFSVLLHEKARGEYTLELLLPQEPDQNVRIAFSEMRFEIEHLPTDFFLPYYTADFRTMMGRYYLVTVNNNGWIIKDYMDIPKQEVAKR